MAVHEVAGPVTPRAAAIVACVLALTLAPGCLDHAARGREALSRGDYPGAQRLLERAVAEHPEEAGLWRDLARTHLRLGAPHDARAAIDEAARLAPDDPAIVLLRGQIRMALRDRDGARDDALWVLERARAPARLQELAILFVRLGMADEALRAASIAVERSGGDAAAYNNLAVLAVEARRLDVARSALAEGRARHPEDVALAEAEAAFFVQRGELKRALAAYRELLPRHPEPGLVHLALALLAHAVGDLDAAVDDARAAVEHLGLERADVHVTYVIVLRDRGLHAEARAHLRRARRRFPHHGELAGLEATLK